MKILVLGDIVGEPGRISLGPLAHYRTRHQLDFVVANIENAAGGFGFTEKTYDQLRRMGIDAFTSGNHVYDKKEVLAKFDRYDQLVRPLNFPNGHPGTGVRYFSVGSTTVAVVNLIGRVFMGPSDCPFQVITHHLPNIRAKSKIILIDFHAETTSEKQAMGWALDGRISALWGTHTHVQTADERILPQGTGYITDLGMIGAQDAILGMDKDPIIQRFFTGLPIRFSPPESKGPCLVNGILLTIDQESGRTTHISRLKNFDE